MTKGINEVQINKIVNLSIQNRHRSQGCNDELAEEVKSQRHQSENNESD